MEPPNNLEMNNTESSNHYDIIMMEGASQQSPLNHGSSASSTMSSHIKMEKPQNAMGTRNQQQQQQQTNTASGSTSGNGTHSNNQDDIKVECIMHDFLFNRLQWYHVTLRFSDSENKPKFVGEYVQFDPKITFVDGRRRNPASVLSTNKKSPLFVSIYAICASTGKQLKKCNRCRDKDKVLTKRKRKRDVSTIWNDLDEENNAKLIQVLSTGEGIVDEHGEIKFRLRVGCCVGVNKQHHLNHLGDDENDKALHIHKNCEGVRLKVEAKTKNRKVLKATASDIVRILGKVTDTDRVKYQKRKKRRIKEGNFTQSKGAPEPPKRDIPFGNGITPIILQQLVHQYRITFDTMFPTPCTQIFSADFFRGENSFFDSFSQTSPVALQVYTILAIGALCSGCGDIAKSFWNCAVELGDALLESKWTRKKDILLLADAVNKVAMYWACIPDYNKARYYNSKAGQLLEQYAAAGKPEILNSSVYESFIWGRLTFNRDPDTLQNGYKFAKFKNRTDIHAYALFLMIITHCAPELITDDAHQNQLNSTEQRRQSVLVIFKELKTILSSPQYKNIPIQGVRTFGTLIEQGLGAMENWIAGNHDQMVYNVHGAAIQAGLIKDPVFAALIPIYFTAFVSLQLTAIDKDKYADLTELCLMAYSRITTFKWARVLGDFLNNSLKAMTGRYVNLAWNSKRNT